MAPVVLDITQNQHPKIRLAETTVVRTQFPLPPYPTNHPVLSLFGCMQVDIAIWAAQRHTSKDLLFPGYPPRPKPALLSSKVLMSTMNSIDPGSVPPLNSVLQQRAGSSSITTGRNSHEAGTSVTVGSSSQHVSNHALTNRKSKSTEKENDAVKNAPPTNADNAKMDFISSISHELRSPLHGILGSVECLQEQLHDATNSGLISQVEVCARTLLDIVNHLLDFSKINNYARKQDRHMAEHRNRTRILDVTGTTSRVGGKMTLDSDVSLDITTEEVVEAAFYSFCWSKEQQIILERNVAFVLDIDRSPEIDWRCRIATGGWKRICNRGIRALLLCLSCVSQGLLDIVTADVGAIGVESEPLMSRLANDKGERGRKNPRTTKGTEMKDAIGLDPLTSGEAPVRESASEPRPRQASERRSFALAMTSVCSLFFP